MSEPGPHDEAAEEPVEPAEAPSSLSDALAAAARQSGLAKLKPGEAPTAHALLAAIGGVRGILESIVPGFAFLVIYSLTHDLLISVGVPVLIALVFVVARAGARSPMTQAIAGAIGIALTAVLALVTNRPENNFLPGIFINAAVIVIFIASIATRWPLVGVFVGLVLGEGTAWRDDAAKRRALTLATWVWVLPSIIRVAVEVPLYLARNTEALAALKLVMGIPLYVGALWLSWLLIRAVYPTLPPDSSSSSSSS